MKDPEGLTAEALAAIRPLPFGRGESRGEGSASLTTDIRNDESFEQRASSFHLSFPSELAAARQACRAVRHFLATEKLTEKEQVACELALTEACNNAVLYAEGFGQRAPLEIQALCRRTGLELQVIDHTPGFDWPAAIALPRAEAEQGRGLFIIHSLMNEVVYLRGRGENRLIMRKQLGARDSLSAPTDLHRPLRSGHRC